MRILSFKPGHDGAVCLVEDGRLAWSLEAEKDSFPRHAEVTPSLVLAALARLDAPPDVICVSGWVKGFHSVERPLEAGYFGWAEAGRRTWRGQFMGRETRFFSSTHERSHVLGAFGMSAIPAGEPCYALVWEGNIGSLYSIDGSARIERLADVMEDPGNKFSFLFGLADPTYPANSRGMLRFENAGKLMALAGFSDRMPATSEERKIIDSVLGRESIILSTPKSEYAWTSVYNAGVEDQRFKNLAGKLSDEIFDRFHRAAVEVCTERRPIVIGGGCALNCDWNSRWRSSGLFSSVFVPPCGNDTGSAIGTALDAQHLYTGSAALDWDVYAGEDFVDDCEPSPDEFSASAATPARVAALLASDCVIAWVQGRYEMGPRALGNRSILAAPFDRSSHDRVNAIKRREGYRPIAPVCLEEDTSVLFEWLGSSPHMLFTARVRSPALRAVTHVDGTARIQTVSAAQNRKLHDLLRAFKERTGYGVLCNTSLNFSGRGFINRMSDLVAYQRERGLDGFVVGDRLFLPAGSAAG